MESRLLGRKIWALSAVGALFSLGPNGCKSSDSDDSGTRGVGSECSSDKDCREFDLLCDTAARACVECLTSSHCRDLEICTNGECVEITPCESSRDCPEDQVCSEALYRCVDCVRDADCADGEVCAGEVCRAACASDKDCREFDLLCATAAGYCVECTSDTHCSDGQRCSAAGTCIGGASAPSGTGGRPRNPRKAAHQPSPAELPAWMPAPQRPVAVTTARPAPRAARAAAPRTAAAKAAEATPVAARPRAGAPATAAVGRAARPEAELPRAAPQEKRVAAALPAPPTSSPPVAETCAILLSPSCLGCCNEVGVFALDREDEDATALIVNSFDGDATQAQADFTFTDLEQVGAIYFALPTELTITDWNLWATYSGGSLEVALSRSKGAAGCIYEPIGAVGTNWTQTGCWPEVSTLGPWDQIEVRVRSYDSGPGSLVVGGFEIE